MKNSGVRIAAVLLLFGLIYACEKKPLPETDSQKPVFYLNALINGQQLYIGAGEDNYFMNSSHFLDTNNVFVLKADLQQTNCNNNCNYAISILINDHKTSTVNDAIVIDEAIKKGIYNYKNIHSAPLFYNVVLKPLRIEKNSEKYRWVINGQETFGYSYSSVTESGKFFKPTFYFEDAEGICSASHSKEYKVGSSLQSDIQVQKEGMPELLMYSFSAIAKGTPPFDYHWQFGDGTADSYSEHPFHRYANQGFFTAKLILTDVNKDTCISFYQVPAFVDPKCEANYKASFTPIYNTKAFSAITIQLKHPDGRIFSSQELAQSETEGFEILEVIDYQLNERKEPTKKIKIKFNCTVQNGTEKISIQNAEAVLAVSYK